MNKIVKIKKTIEKLSVEFTYSELLKILLLIIIFITLLLIGIKQ